jgi:hypothetical protein
MAAFLQQTDFEIERTGVTASVPNNDVARLMYYMKCVCTAIDCNQDPEIQRFTNYHNWSYLSFDERKALVVGCYTFSPDILENKVFFHSNVLCVDSLNEFYTVSQVRHQILAAESIIIAGRARQVNKIMTYKMEWMREYYFEPIQRLASRFTAASERTALVYQPTVYQPTYVPVVVGQPIRQGSSLKAKHYIYGGVIIVIIIIIISSFTRLFS